MKVTQIKDLVVFSTYVEVILIIAKLLIFSSGFLHVCGGDPKVMQYIYSAGKFSPRMWR